MICMYGEFLSVLVLETQVKLPILPTPQNLEIFLKSYIQKEREKKKKEEEKGMILLAFRLAKKAQFEA